MTLIKKMLVFVQLRNIQLCAFINSLVLFLLICSFKILTNYNSNYVAKFSIEGFNIKSSRLIEYSIAVFILILSFVTVLTKD